MKQEKLISVIIPAYMVEEYIEKCVDSVINQTYKNLEIILVDDGSKDKSGQICDKYLEKDSRVKVIHKENGGLSDARNVGIENATGELIAFVDSDDYVEKDMFEVLYNKMMESGCRMATCAPRRVFLDGTTIDDGNHMDKVLDKIEALERLLYGNGLGCSSWAKLFDIHLFDEIRFPKGRNYEEIATSYRLIDQCDKIACYSYPMYNYVIRENSITQGQFSEKKFLLIETTNQMCDYVLERYPELKKAALRRRIYANVSIYRQIVESGGTEFAAKEKELKKYIIKHGIPVAFDSKAPKRDRAAVLLILLGRNIFKMAFNVNKRMSRKKGSMA